MRPSLMFMSKAIALVSAVMAVAGCGSVSDPPLGGPYGGTASATGPTTGTSTSPTDPGADPGATDGGSSGGRGSSGSAGSSGASGSSSGSSSGTSGSASSSGSSASSSGSSASSASSSSSGASGSSSGSSGPPTWTQIWTSYFAPGTAGNCAKSGCHSQTATAPGAYTWLKGRRYISTTNAPLADPAHSCLTWLGGNMPPSGAASNTAATTALTAWAAAGAPNN